MAGWSIVVPSREVARLDGLVHAHPHPALSGRVLTYTAVDHAHPEPLSWRVAPVGAITASIDLCPAPRDLPPHPVTGLRDTPMTITDPAGRSCAITIALTPDGAHALFGLPLREIANRAVAWTDLLGRRAATIPDQLAEAPDWRTRFRLLDQHLVTLMRPRALTPQVRGAWHRLTTTAGAIRVDTLADELGWTRQHLHTRFRAQIGLSPKTVARLARLGRASTLMSHPNPRPLAEIAALCGYTDQSHLNRDFRAITGGPPGDYLAPEPPFTPTAA